MDFTSINDVPPAVPSTASGVGSTANVYHVIANTTRMGGLGPQTIDQTTATDLFIIKAYKIITNGTLLNSSHINEAISYFKRTQDGRSTSPSIHPQYAGSFAKISQMYNYLIPSGLFGDGTLISAKTAVELFQQFQKILKELESNFGLSPYGIFFDKIRDNLFLIREDAELMSSIGDNSVTDSPVDLERYIQFWAMLTGYILQVYNPRTGNVITQQETMETTEFNVQKNGFQSAESTGFNITNGGTEAQAPQANDVLMINDNILCDTTSHNKFQDLIVPQVPGQRIANGNINTEGNTFNDVGNDSLFSIFKAGITGGHCAQLAAGLGSANLPFGWSASDEDPLERESFGSTAGQALFSDITDDRTQSVDVQNRGEGSIGSIYGGTPGSLDAYLNARGQQKANLNALPVATRSGKLRRSQTHDGEDSLGRLTISGRNTSNASSLPVSSGVRTGIPRASKRSGPHQRTNSMPSSCIGVSTGMVRSMAQLPSDVKPVTVAATMTATKPLSPSDLVVPVPPSRPGIPKTARADGSGIPTRMTTMSAYQASLSAYLNLLSRQYEDLVREKDKRISLLEKELEMQRREAVWLRELLIGDIGYVRNVLQN